jgi:lysophospholipase L1-like esterase
MISHVSPKLRIRAAALMMSACIGTTACDKLGLGDESPTTPSPPSTGTPVRYAAVGASDVNGVGSSAPCLIPFTDCPDSPGYVFVASKNLRARGFTVTLTNLGLPTAVISRRFQDLGLRHGHPVYANLIESLLPFVPRDATVVTIFAGGNDVNVITAALGGGAGGTNPTAYIDLQVQNFASDYIALLNGLRERTPSARIIALNVPNLARMPYLAGASPSHRQAVHRAAVGMTTTAINPLASQGVRVVDLMCMAQLYQASSLSSDGFHPNDAGYALLANEVVRAVTATSFAAPSSSCSQMTQVP